MKFLLTALVVVVVAFIALRVLVALTSSTTAASGPRTDAVAGADSQGEASRSSGTAAQTENEGLGPCKNTPNCVSSTDTRDNFYVAPIPLSNANPLTLADIRSYLIKQPRVTIVTASDTYLHATVKTTLMGYVDDVEFYQTANEIQLRSASRIGHSDLGANRKRLDVFRAELVAPGQS